MGFEHENHSQSYMQALLTYAMVTLKLLLNLQLKIVEYHRYDPTKAFKCYTDIYLRYCELDSIYIIVINLNCMRCGCFHVIFECTIIIKLIIIKSNFKFLPLPIFLSHFPKKCLSWFCNSVTTLSL